MLQGTSGTFRIVSNTEPFRDILKDWRDDDMFAEQRLSGSNPQALRRVTDDCCKLRLQSQSELEDRKGLHKSPFKTFQTSRHA